jgi:hypothetical protein
VILPPAKRIVTTHPDLVVLSIWWGLVIAIGFIRKDFTGDGVRHLGHIVTSDRPSLGAARWLLFPVFLYGILRPTVWLGLVHDVESLTRAMMAVTVVAAGVYGLALRACLRSVGVPASRRAAALAVALCSAGLFFAAIDLMEPIFGAALIMCGLAFAARRTNSVEVTGEQRRRGVLLAVTAIAIATLSYQGLILGLGLIPLVVPKQAWRDRTLLIEATAILAGMALLMWGILVWDGLGLAQAVKQLVRGADNPAYATFMKKPGILSYIVAVVAGPPQGLITLGDFHGFNGIIAGLKTPGQRRAGLEMLARFGLGTGVLVVGVGTAFRRRDCALLIGLGTLLLLPLLRRQQYGYIKFWILLPPLLAFGASRAATWIATAVALLFFALNVPATLAALPAGNRSYRDHMQAFAKADARSCWLTSAWVPPYFFRWPGQICPILGTLSEDTGDDPAAILTASRRALTVQLQDCFCRSSAVFTDDMLEKNRPVLTSSAEHFGYSDVDLTALTLGEAQGTALSRTTPIVWTYPKSLQRRLCEVVMEARPIP